MGKVKRVQSQQYNEYKTSASKREHREKLWHKENLPGENRGQFLTRKWKEILKTYPVIEQDRNEFVVKVQEEERVQMMKSW